MKSRLHSFRQQAKPLKREDPNDDQLFRFLNSNLSSSKEKKSSKESPGLIRKTTEAEIPVKIDTKKPEGMPDSLFLNHCIAYRDILMIED